MLKRLLFYSLLIVLVACRAGGPSPTTSDPNYPPVSSDSMYLDFSDSYYDTDGDGIPDAYDDYPEVYDYAEGAYESTESSYPIMLDDFNDGSESSAMYPEEVVAEMDAEIERLENALTAARTVNERADEYIRAMENLSVVEEHAAASSLALTPVIADPNKGILAYSVDDTMKVGEVHDVILRISRKGSEKQVTVELDNAVTTVIKTSASMEVLLFDPDPVQDDQKFVILQTTNAEQYVADDTTYTQWVWKVKPIKAGDHQLKLVINIRKKTEFGSSLKSIKVFEKLITIKSTPSYSIIAFLKKYWTFIASSIVIPFIVFLWKRRKKKNMGMSSI